MRRQSCAFPWVLSFSTVFSAVLWAEVPSPQAPEPSVLRPEVPEPQAPQPMVPVPNVPEPVAKSPSVQVPNVLVARVPEAEVPEAEVPEAESEVRERMIEGGLLEEKGRDILSGSVVKLINPVPGHPMLIAGRVAFLDEEKVQVQVPGRLMNVGRRELQKFTKAGVVYANPDRVLLSYELKERSEELGDRKIGLALAEAYNFDWKRSNQIDGLHQVHGAIQKFEENRMLLSTGLQRFFVMVAEAEFRGRKLPELRVGDRVRIVFKPTGDLWGSGLIYAQSVLFLGSEE